MANILGFLDKQPKWLIFVIGLFLVAILGYIDYLTGEFSILVFYFIPIVLVTWSVGWWQGIFIAVLSGIARFITEQMFVTNLGRLYWNSCEETICLITVAIILYALRRSLRS